MINFLKNTYYKLFTYKKEYENNRKDFCEYAYKKINIFKRLSIICHLVYLAFTVYAVIKIIECARNHVGADLYFVELIVFSLMGITAILQNGISFCWYLFLPLLPVPLDNMSISIISYNISLWHFVPDLLFTAADCTVL